MTSSCYQNPSNIWAACPQVRSRFIRILFPAFTCDTLGKELYFPKKKIAASFAIHERPALQYGQLSRPSGSPEGFDPSFFLRPELRRSARIDVFWPDVPSIRVLRAHRYRSTSNPESFWESFQSRFHGQPRWWPSLRRISSTHLLYCRCVPQVVNRSAKCCSNRPYGLPARSLLFRRFLSASVKDSFKSRISPRWLRIEPTRTNV